MDAETREAADGRFEAALEASGARDPRDFYRTALRELKDVNPSAYEEAVRHFQEVLVPSIASGEADPLLAWREYGRLIAEVTAKGKTVVIDDSGRSQPYGSSTPLDRLVLHLPDAGGRALLVALPPKLSPAQRATWELLVQGKQRLSE